MIPEESKDYNDAKHDMIKAMCSFQKLKPEYQQQLLQELVGAEAYAAVWRVIRKINNTKR